MDKAANRIVDLPSILAAIQSAISCSHCIRKQMNSFLLFCEQKRQQVMTIAESKKRYQLSFQYLQCNSNVSNWYKEWEHANSDTKESSLTITDTTYGLATNIAFSCNHCNCVLATSEAAKTTNHATTKSDFCKYDINL
jgi:hypothetical protein